MTYRPARSLGALAIALAAFSAQASNTAISLTGNPLAVQVNSGITYDESLRFTNYALQLGGLSPANPMSLAQGDSFTATLTFSTPLTVPASTAYTFWNLALQGTSFPSGSTRTDGTVSLGYQGTTVFSDSTNCSSSQQLANCFITFAPESHQITIDSMTWSSSITTLDAPALLDRASLSYTIYDPVPEPLTAVLLSVGLAVLALRERGRVGQP